MLELVKSHYSNNKSTFEKVLSEVIEHENEKGSKATAQKLKNIQQNGSNKLVPISTALGGKIQFVKAAKTLDSLFQKEAVISALSQIQLEYSKEEMLLNYGLKPIKKIMFLGPSGTGKTMYSSRRNATI